MVDLKPSLPITTPCLSYWQRTSRGFPHLNSRKIADVPTSKKYVVIGSGISGGLTAFELTENGVSGSDIVILEAREAASGASSRNAGHVRPDAFRGFKHYSSFHGPEQALKIIANERAVLEKAKAFVKKHNVQCDLNVTNTFDVCMTPEFAAYEAESFEAYKNAGGDVSHVKFYPEGEASAATGIANVFAAYKWPAGSSHPAKLAQWLLNAAIERGVELYTHCPVEKVGKSIKNEGSWDVSTPRGVITTSNVVHCTNAYAAYLLPQLASILTPNKAQAHSFIAPPAFSAEKALTSTYSLRYSLQHFYSVIQRKGDGTLILGVSRTNPTLSTETLAGIVSFDDSHYVEEVLSDSMKQWDILFPDEDAALGGGGIHGAGLDNPWSGIIGMTGDHVPFVGPVESMKGQWLCAGFGGHGMARIFSCAPGLAKLITGKTWSDTGLPECFQLTEERAAKMSQGLKSKL